MWSNYGRELLNITAETNAQEAMMNCHRSQFCQAWISYHCHDSFYKMAQHEFAYAVHIGETSCSAADIGESALE